MIRLIKESCKPIYRFATSRYYREYYRLFSKYSRRERYHEAFIKFLSYSIQVPDVLSFIHQYKEIFLDQSYHFETQKSSPVIYDCGSNIGLSCLYFKRLYPNCILKCFEADPDIFKILTSNAAANLDPQSIYFYNKAIWTHNNGVEFNLEGSDAGTLMPVQGNKKIKVDSIRLKDLLATETIDFLKLDIEGAEVEVLIDCDTVLKNVDKIFFEYHSFSGDNQRLHEILKVLNHNNFKYFIQSPYLIMTPFCVDFQSQQMDLQLNVYCYK